MSKKNVVRWMCDRCGKKDYFDPGLFPLGWKRVAVDDYLVGPIEDELCPECASEFMPKWKNFMQEKADETVCERHAEVK